MFCSRRFSQAMPQRSSSSTIRLASATGSTRFRSRTFYRLQVIWPATLTDPSSKCSFSTTDGKQAIAKEKPSRAALQARLAADDGRPLDAFPLTAIRIETEGSTRLIGTIGLHAADTHPAFPFREACWDLGYVLLPSYGGRGIGTAAPRAALAVWEQLGNVKAYGAFGASLLDRRPLDVYALTSLCSALSQLRPTTPPRSVSCRSLALSRLPSSTRIGPRPRAAVRGATSGSRRL